MAPYVYTWKNVLITLIFNLENQAAKEDRYNMILFFFLNIGSQAHKTLYFKKPYNKNSRIVVIVLYLCIFI